MNTTGSCPVIEFDCPSGLVVVGNREYLANLWKDLESVDIEDLRKAGRARQSLVYNLATSARVRCRLAMGATPPPGYKVLAKATLELSDGNVLVSSADQLPPSPSFSTAEGTYELPKGRYSVRLCEPEDMTAPETASSIAGPVSGLAVVAALGTLVASVVLLVRDFSTHWPLSAVLAASAAITAAFVSSLWRTALFATRDEGEDDAWEILLMLDANTQDEGAGDQFFEVGG